MKSRMIHRNISMLALCVVMLLLGSTPALASTSKITAKKTIFDIRSKIYVDGKFISSPRIITFANKKASLSIENEGDVDSLKYEVIAKNVSNNDMNSPIQIYFNVQYRSGHESIQTQPRMTLLPKQAGVISFKTDSGHTYEMQVLAERTANTTN